MPAVIAARVGWKATRIGVPILIVLTAVVGLALFVGPVDTSTRSAINECAGAEAGDAPGVGVQTTGGVIGPYFYDVGRPVAPTLVPLGEPGPTIFGTTVVTAQQAKQYWATNRGGRQPSRLNLPINDFIDVVWEEAAAEGIAADLVFAQMILETGGFTNTDTSINNFAGVGHYDNVRSGFDFLTVRNGVRVQVQLLKKVVLGNTLTFVSPPEGTVNWNGSGSTNHWRTLGDAGWATAENYGDIILNSVYKPMVESAATLTFAEIADGDDTTAPAGNDPCATDATRAADLQPQFGPDTGGDIACPMPGSDFGDTWRAPRSGGRTHKGVDMIAQRGLPIYAVEDGTVTFKHNNLGGNAVSLAGASGTRYYYGHLDSYVGVSRAVKRAELIGYNGDTGNAKFSTPHLHFEVRPGGGDNVNPYPYVVAAGC